MKYLLLIYILCCVLACADKSKTKAESKYTDKTAIFPVSSFVAGQVHEVDSVGPRIMKYTSIDNHTDSGPVTRQEFKTLAKEFMDPDISGPAYSGYYKESSFADQSLPSVTLTYSALKQDLEVQRLDVVIQPDPVVNDKVQSIYMEKLTNRKDTSILKKLFWKTDQNFQIITSTQAGNNQPEVVQLKVAW